MYSIITKLSLYFTHHKHIQMSNSVIKYLLVSSIVVDNDNTTSYTGNPLNLTCTAVIHPNVSINSTFEWMGSKLSKLDNTTFQNILTIERLTESYNGTYSCYVMVDSYTNKSDYRLHVTSKHYSMYYIYFILTFYFSSIFKIILLSYF